MTLHYLDLSDYWHLLKPYKGKNGEALRECPVCNGKLSINRNDKGLFSCFDGCDRSEIRRALIEADGNRVYSFEQIRAREEREHAKVEAERERVSKLRSEAERDKDWKQIINKSILSPEHHQQLLDRGFTPALIAASNARSSAKGLIIPIRTATGLIVGSQVYCASGKFWYGESGQNQLKETGALPLAVVCPYEPLTGIIAYTESTLHKPWLTAQNWRMVTIGSANIGSQFNDLVRSISTIKSRFGWSSVTHILMADGGAVTNKMVLNNYTTLNQQISRLGGKLLVRWWGQIAKGGTDVDEIATSTPYQDITFDEFLAIATKEQNRIAGVSDIDASAILAGKLAAEAKEEAAKKQRAVDDRKHYELLTNLSMDKHGEIDLREEQYLSTIPLPAAGTFGFVSSPCGTGKTEQVKAIIAEWKATAKSGYLPGKLIDITHRNSLRDGHQKRLGIDDYKVGSGQNEAALNSLEKVSICVDSLDKLDVNEIPSRSLVILDEMEAILAHLAGAGTLGNRAAGICHHFARVLIRVLGTGGMVVGLEDNLTDIAINMMLNITNRAYSYKLIINQFERFHWDVQIGSSEFGYYLTSLLHRLDRGERLIIPTTSQRFAETFERLAIYYIPSLAGHTLRIDSKTAPELEEVLRDPNQYLRDNGIRLCIPSPTVESGMSIDEGFFDRRVAYFVNLETRQHIQLLHRERSNIPTDIFIKSRGADANSSPRNFRQLLKVRKQIALATSMILGDGSVEPEGDEAKREGNLWNEYSAMIAARKQLAANHSKEYLALDLEKRQHNVSMVDWAVLASEEMAIARQNETDFFSVNATNDQYKFFRNEIEREENEILFLAEGLKIRPIDARSILGSSNQPFAKKQQAVKCLTHERFPGADLTEEFLMEVITKHRGRYGRQIEKAWLLDKPELCKELDRRQFISQKAGRHFRYDQTSKHTQIANLFAPILADLQSLVEADEFSKADDTVNRIKTYAVNKAADIFRLLGLNIKPESEDSNGKITHSAIDTVNKLLKSLGYRVEVARKEGGKGQQVRFYQVTNGDCPHRETIGQALERKHQDYLNKLGEAVVTVSNTIDTNLETVTTSLKPLSVNEVANIKVGDVIEINGLKVNVCFKNGLFISGHYQNGAPFVMTAA